MQKGGETKHSADMFTSTGEQSGMGYCFNVCVKHVSKSSDTCWILDTSVTNHMISDTSFFSTIPQSIVIRLIRLTMKWLL